MGELDKKIAYFCMEFGLDVKLPLYAGGLGILAGDYLKAAKKLNAPVVGIGIWWWQDYTHQFINEDGYPYDTFPVNRDKKHIEDTGKKITVNIENSEIEISIYKVTDFNNAPLYLLDTGGPDSEYGWITNKLYSGDNKERIAQEMILGIGGVKALRTLGIEIDKYHFNEGHAAFAGFELMREKMHEYNKSFKEAWQEIKNEIVFTTHTPVPAGNESHDVNLLQHMGAANGLSLDQLKSIGGQPFNMTAACLKMSSIANGVSKIHKRTAGHMWSELEDSAPIISITNGVSIETWQDPSIKNVMEDRDKLWDTHMSLKRKLVDYIKENTEATLNPDNLIIGFARRAAPYKRSELIFRDTQQIDPFLKEGKLQLIFSGKAHPDDHYGKKIVARLVKMDKKYKDSIVFLENYNMEIASYLTRGCDVWLNNPRRPLEASGTSGMKVAINGGLNLSVLDGWVAEGVKHGVHGWILDQLFCEMDDCVDQDQRDLRALYQIIKEEVIPIYYEDRERWINMMYESIKMSHYNFSSARMLKEYYQQMYNKQKVASRETYV